MKKKNIKKAKVKAPLTVKTKQNGKEVNSRVYANTPHGFKKDDGATTQPSGTVMANNGKSLFATKPDGKPARKQVVVLKDKEAFRTKNSKQQKSETAGSKSSAKAATKKADKPASKKSKKIEFGRLMPDGKVIKAKGDYYKAANGIEVGISKDTNGRYYATELSTGKLVSLRTGDKSIVDAVNFVEKYSSEIKKAMDTNTQIPASALKNTKQPATKKRVNFKTKPNNLEVTTYCINKGTPSQHFILKTTETDNSQVLRYAPNNWKTEKGALKWAEKNGFATPKAATPKPTVTKASQKTAGKSTSASNNSVKAAVTAKQNAAKPAAPKKAEAKPEKRRVYKSLPKGYSVVQGTVAQVDGTILIHNGKPLFKQNKDGTTQQAKDSHGKPAHKTAALIVDPQAFNEAKSAERKLVDVEIRKHNDAMGGHPHIMVDTVGDKNVSVGITHDKYKGKKHANIPLEVNPLGENRQAYMRKQGTVDSDENYSQIRKTGKLTDTDNAKAKQIGERAKQKERNKQTPQK